MITLMSRFFVPTLKETPADAEILSHQLMLKAGLVRKLSSGLYSWLPLGLRVLRKVETIVREEMTATGAVEMLMPAVQPAELWEESGRWDQFGPQLLKMQDRHERNFCFGPTHEEVITDLMRRELNSYKQLPLTVFQLQTKFRDEIRPRFGVMRSREFMMKDAYSFHDSMDSLAATYDTMYTAYSQIFTRLGLSFRAVDADTGSIGGHVSQEFHVLADTGEDTLVYSDGSDYAANLEKAKAKPSATAAEADDSAPAMRTVDTPDCKTITDVSDLLDAAVEQTVKTLLVKGIDTPAVALVLRGDHTLNTLKAEKFDAVAAPLTMVDDKDFPQLVGCEPGSVGPVGLEIPVLVDHEAAAINGFICGANQDGKHYTDVYWTRDLPCPDAVDLRDVCEGDPSPDGQGHLQFTRGIEVGHIFQLGDKYSVSMKATVLNENGKAVAPLMGCYGIGLSRIVGAAIEQHHDDYGIIWPQSMSPFDIHLIPINQHKSDTVAQACAELQQQLRDAGYDVLMDDRPLQPGKMFADADLIGIRHRVVISEKTLANNELEYKRRDQADKQMLTTATLLDLLQQ